MARAELRWPGRTARAHITAIVPSAPVNVTSIAVDAGATVSWQHPGDEGTTTYTVTPYIAGSAQATTTVAYPAQSAAVTGLVNATAYTFSVHATNASGSSAESAQSGANTPRVNLIFGDEFNGTVLDPAWAVLTRDGDQSNSEQQYYVPGRVSLDGASNLVIHAQSGSVTLPGYNDANPPTYAGANVTRSYTSGCVLWNTFSFTYGKVQASAKVPRGNFLWPAIWMMGSNCQVSTPLNPDSVGTCNWPQAGSEENDIVEILEGAGGSVATYDANYFYPSGNMGGPTHSVSSADTTFHTYETQWSAGSLAWLLDGASWQTFGTSVASTPMFLIIQTAVQPGGTATFAQPDLVVDWVRAFHN